MMTRRIPRPSPAMVVALIALIVALGGTSYAAFTLPKNSVGTKQLKNAAVTTKKISNGAVTASKIKTAGLIAPNALHANLADSAISATNAAHAANADSATNATNATHATNADTLGTLPPSAFVSANALMTSGIVKFSSGTRTLVSKGPLSITASCSGGPIVEVDANTTEPGTKLFFADGNAAVDVTPGSPRNIGATVASDSGDYAVLAPSGASRSGYFSEGVNILGSTCAALAYGIG